ncbi:hypothetical protein [Nitrosovibrio sp. Nv17]|uniref:hypothetical protein n=1 Tax=Nitrosovibrio sp. Nv17 TaxID=1855339 RepID=UPI000908B4D9|nr:hypothetical protein [Nitrosovibrio sp. Nv17]SFW21790.1 hypothetical protein SAMN05216414_106106 [Nitrosovibrio sp. Nv17]
MKPWRSFHDLVAPDLPGCPPEAIDHALRRAAAAFFELSMAWRFDHPGIAVEAGVAEYALVLPEDAVAACVLRAALDGMEIGFVVDGHAPARWDRPAPIHGPVRISGSATSVKLAPEPRAPGLLALEVALKPAMASAGIDDALFEAFRQPIAHGALAELMLSPAKPYTHAQLAAHHQRRFEAGTAAEGLRAARGFGRSALRTSVMAR